MGWPLALAVGFSAPGLAQTLPQGGTVVGGAGTITQTAPNQLTINQASPNLAVDWQSFSIGANNIVRFVQPSTSAVALNRVLNGDPAQIYGQIQANGQVVVMSPNGIVFGPSSRVDVNALVATTANISTVDFMAGKLLFDQASSDANARVVNQGVISVAQGGFAVLAAANVSNQGQIIANGGTVVLGGTKTFAIDFHGDGLLKFAATGIVDQKPAGADALVENSGSIEANGGRVLLTARAARSVLDNVINTTGIVVAKTASLVNGEIVIDGGDAGIVSVKGTLDASGANAGESGGTVKVLGEKVGLFENARIDASGTAGGGTVLVGGNYQGKGPEANAQYLYMDARAVIDASAVSNGDGGTVILWADKTTRFDGRISARGGSLGGNGGFVETSGKIVLRVGMNASVDTGATVGRVGTWLLDPNNITISAPPDIEGNVTDADLSANSNFTSIDDGAIVFATTINSAFSTGNVTVTTDTAGSNSEAGDITVTGNIVNSYGARTLTLVAGGAINITGTGSIAGSVGNALSVALNATNGVSIGGAGIDTYGGSLNVTTNTPGNGAITQTAAISAGTASFAAGANAITLNNAGNNFTGSVALSNSGANNVAIWDTNALALGTVGIGSGTFTVNAGGGITQTGAITQAAGGGAVTISAGTGSVALSEANSWSGALAVSGATVNVTGAQTFINAGSVNATFTQTGAGGTMSLSNIVATAGAVNIVASSDTQLAIGGNITTLGGAVALYGNAPGGNPNSGTSVGNHKGVWIDTGAVVDAGGGNIVIAGRGGNNDYNYGVYITGAQVKTTGSGTLTIVGLGGTGGSTDLAGVAIDATSLVRTQNGNLTITGTGTSGAGGYNYGVYVNNTSTVGATGNGAIALTGTGGVGAESDSIYVGNSTLSTAGTGGVTITGNTPGGAGKGVNIAASGTISTTGVGAVAIVSGGAIHIDGSLTGTGSIALDAANTVVVNGSIATGAGAITIWGNAPGGNNLTGTSVGTAWGVQLNATALISSGTGAISIVGKGSADSGAGQHGIVLFNGGTIQSTTGDISLLGRGGDGTAGGHGIVLVGGTIQSASGNVSLAGWAGYSGANPDGIQLSNGAHIHSDSGALSLTGIGAGLGYGLAATGTGSTIGDPVSTGNIDLVADTMSIGASTLGIETDGEVHIRPVLLDTAIGIGGGAAGTLLLPGNMDFVAAALLVVGDNNTGPITVGAGGFSNTNGTDLGLQGTSIALNGDVTLAANATLTLYAKTFGVLQTSGTVTATNLVLRGGGDFVLFHGGSGANAIENVAADVTGDLSIATGSAGISRAASLTDGLGTVIGISTGGGLGWLAANGLTQTATGLLSVTGPTNLTAQNGTLDMSVVANSFGGQVAATSGGGGSILLKGGTLALGIVNSAGDVILNATGGGITQAGLLTANGNLNASANGGPVGLSTYQNLVSGSVSLATSGGSNNIAWVQNGPMLVGSISSSGQLDLSVTGGGISQAGPIAAAGATTLSVNAGDIVLTNAANEFADTVVATNTVGGISLRNTGNTLFGNIVSNGVLNISVVGGTLSQLSASTIATTGNATVTLAGAYAMTLTEAGNNFGGNLALSGSTGTLNGTIGGTASATTGTFVVNGTTIGTAPPPPANSTAPAPGAGVGGTTVSSALTDVAPISQIQGAAALPQTPPDAVSVVADAVALLTGGPAGPAAAAGLGNLAEGGEGGPAVSPVGVVSAPPAPPPAAAGPAAPPPAAAAGAPPPAIVTSSGPNPGVGGPPLVSTTAPPPAVTAVGNVGGASAPAVNGGAVAQPSSAPRTAVSSPFPAMSF